MLRIVTLIGLFTLLIGLGALSSGFNKSHKFQVEITKEGFSPNEITVPKGSVVTFVNLSGRNAWPASDPHPIHDFLSGFDPQKQLKEGEKWSYKFDQPGTWRYHDHLNVTLRGTINVLGTSIAQTAQYKTYGKDCGGQCFDELVRKTVHEEGIDAAYQLFTDTYAKGELPRSCHWTAHQIGEATYELFREGKEFNITSATSYCGFGFYHGFLEGLLREKPDTEYALNFCAKVQKQLGEMGLYNCIHGIGHGFTEDPPDPTIYGNADLMLKPGIQMCEQLFGKKFSDLNLCLTGVYTVTAGFYDKNQYGLSWNDEDPFDFCRTQPYRYQKACYGEFVPKLDKKLKGDLTRIPKYLEGIKDDKIIRLIVWVAPSVFISRDILDEDHSKYINDCRKAFTDRLLKICWGGTILGFFAHGEPEKQYIKVINFCNSNLFSSDEKEFCFEEGLRQAGQNYNEEKMKEVCGIAPVQYQKYCFNTYNDPPYDDPSFDNIL